MKREPEMPSLRIGELSRRVGVSEHLLRAWELRYDLLTPARSGGGYRLYSPSDEVRVRRMLEYLSQGLAAAQAAHAAKSESWGEKEKNSLPNSGNLDFEQAYSLLRESLDKLDEPGAQVVLDGFFAEFTLERVLRDLFLPYLREMGNRWQAKTLTVGQEHFASNILRGRLAQLARGWGEGNGPTAILACPPGEVHEFALLISGIMLHRNGWTIQYFGSDTPVSDVIELAKKTQPKLVLMSAIAPERYASITHELRELSALTKVVLTGRGANRTLADLCGANLVEGDPVSAAQEIAKVIK